MTVSVREATEDDAGEVLALVRELAAFERLAHEVVCTAAQLRAAYRGRGYGRALLDHVRSRTDGRVDWEVLDWNADAIAVYEHVGAHPVRGWTHYRWTPQG